VRRQQDQGRRLAETITFAVPVVMVPVGWMLAGLLATGNPFAVWGHHSLTIEAPQALGLTMRTLSFESDRLGVLARLAAELLWTAPIFVIALGTWGWAALRRRTGQLPLASIGACLVTAAGIIVAQLAGDPAAAERSWLVLLPLGLWVLLDISRARGRAGARLTPVALAIAVAVSLVGVGQVAVERFPATSEIARVLEGDRSRSEIDQLRAIAHEIDRIEPDGPVVADADTAFGVIALSRRTATFAPLRNELPPYSGDTYVPRAILVRDPQAGVGDDGISRRYPALYDLGAPWATLAAEWHAPATAALPDGVGWRLFRITPQ
jgi:hypothetical protein